MKDFFSDNGHLFAASTLDYDLPDYVKDGDSQMEKCASLDDSCFAIPSERSLPMHTRGHVFSSAIYLAKRADEANYSAAKDTLHKRAEVFGILDDVVKVEAFMDSLEFKSEKTAESTSVPFEIKVGLPLMSKLAGCGKRAIEKAAEKLLSVINDMPVEFIQPAAISMIKAAQDSGVEVSEFNKYAEIGSNDPTSIVEQKNLRLQFITDSLEKSAAIKELAKVDSANKLLLFDRSHKMAKFYGRNLDAPHSVFHSSIEASTPPSEESKIAEAFVSGGTSSDVYKFTVAAFGAERSAKMFKSGSLDLNEGEMKILRQYV